MMMGMTGLTFEDPWCLLLALLVPLGLWIGQRRGAPAVRFAPGALLARRVESGQPSSWRVRLLPLPRVLQVLGLLAAIVALARPVRRDRLPHVTEGIDILLCVDVSSSMAANDMDLRRTRLEVAKEAALQFIAARRHDRIGLITFARYPDLVSPLTLDHQALSAFLANVQRVEADGPEDATGIGTAVARAARVLRSSVAKSKVVILLTDGEENVATAETPDEIAPLHAAQLCKELGVRVYTIVAGAGNPDRRGGRVPLDTRQARRLADLTGGGFFEAKSAGAVAGVYAHIDELEKVALEEPRFKIEERFLPFLIAAMALLFASRLLHSTALAVLP